MLKKRILSLGILTAFLTGMAVFPTSIASAAPLGNGQTYYVATDGSDTNDGSLNGNLAAGRYLHYPRRHLP